MKTAILAFLTSLVLLAFVSNVHAQTEYLSPYLVNVIESDANSLESIYVSNDFSYGGDLGYWSSDNFEFSQVNDKWYSDFIGVLLSASNTNTIDYKFTNSNLQQFLPGQILSIYMFVPTDTSDIDSISVFLEFDNLDGDNNDNDGFKSVSYAINELKVGDWNRLSITVPNYLTLNTFGVNVQAKNTGGIPPLYVDLFTSNPANHGFASINSIENLRQDSVGTDFTAFSWEPPLKGKVEFYAIERASVNRYNFESIDTTTLHFYIDEDVLSESKYWYKIIPIDSLGRSSRSGSREIELETLSFPANTSWDFETGTENWQVDNYTNLVQVDSISYSDRNSLLISTTADTTNHFFFLKGEQLKSIIPNQTVFFNLRINADDLSKINSLETYFIDSSDGVRTTVSYSSEKLIAEAWNKLILKIPDQTSSDSLKEIGIRIKKKAANDIPKLFIDLITTVPYNNGVPTISAPSNFQVTDTSYTELTLEWSPSEGTGEARYELVKMNRQGIPFFFVTDTVTNTLTKIEGLVSGINYNFELTAIDIHGKRTTTEILSITTKKFERHPRFDFETENEGWIAEQATISRTDTNATSGYYSIKLKTLADKAHFRITRDESNSISNSTRVRNLQPAHTLAYRFWISDEDKAKIKGLRFFAIDNQSKEEDKFISTDSFESDTWFGLSFQIPESFKSVKTTGFEIVGQNEGQNPDITLYIDFISTLRDAKPLPRLSIPTDFSVDIVNSRLGYILSWSESTGSNVVSRYNIYRADSASTNFEKFELDGSTSTTTFSKMFIGSGTHQIRVTAVDLNGLETLPSEPIYITIKVRTDISEESGIPKNFALNQNYPNPFNPTTTITYDVPKASNIEISVFDITGRLVKSLGNEFKNPGTHSITFDAANLASGVYLYQLKTNSFTIVKRMLLIK